MIFPIPACRFLAPGAYTGAISESNHRDTEGHRGEGNEREKRGEGRENGEP
jgi:hypothetical protein